MSGEGDDGARSFGYRAHLDGIRTIAVYLVVAFHASVDRVEGGFIGVDVFFVLSGYLVTTILVRDVAGDGRIGWGRFYSRRVRRLLPAALVNLIVTAVVFRTVATPAEFDAARRSITAAALYVANWFFVRESADYFGTDVDASPVAHYWSLSVEEQFYLLWPLVLGGLFLVWRRWGRGHDGQGLAGLRATVIGLGLVSLVAAHLIARTDIDRAYFGTDTRAYQLLAGAALALSPGLASWVRARMGEPVLRVGSGVALVGLLVTATNLASVDPIVRGTITVGLALVLLVSLEASSGGPVRQVLSLAPMTYLGRISYGTYLWHWLVIVVIVREYELSSPVTAVVAALVATAIAAASYHLLEMPIRTAAALDAPRRAVVAVGLGLSVIVALVAVPPILEPPSTSVVAAGTGVNGAGPPITVDWEAAQFSRFDYDRCPAGDANACQLVDGDGPRMMVIGDSHAAGFTPMLEEVAARLDADLWVGFLDYCPWPHGMQYNGVGATCLAEQDEMYSTTVAEVDPDVVFLAHRPVDDPVDPFDIADVHGLVPPERKAEVIENAVRRAISELREQGARVVAFEPVPIAPTGEDPIACLSQGRPLDECRFTASSEPLGEEEVLRDLVEPGGVWTFDVDRIACPELPVCDPVVDGLVVRADQNHLAVSFSVAALTDPVAEFLVENDVLE